MKFRFEYDEPKLEHCGYHPRPWLLRWIPGVFLRRKMFVLVEEFVCRIYNGNGRVMFTISVDADFRTDLASSPWWLWWLFPPHGQHAVAAIMHDWLYTKAADCDRFTADNLLRYLMTDRDCSLAHQRMAYYAVRFFGWLHFQRH